VGLRSGINMHQSKVYVYPARKGHALTLGVYKPYSGSDAVRIMLGPLWIEVRSKEVASALRRTHTQG
jgi:hypothetical protein